MTCVVYVYYEGNVKLQMELMRLEEVKGRRKKRGLVVVVVGGGDDGKRQDKKRGESLGHLGIVVAYVIPILHVLLHCLRPFMYSRPYTGLIKRRYAGFVSFVGECSTGLCSLLVVEKYVAKLQRLKLRTCYVRTWSCAVSGPFITLMESSHTLVQLFEVAMSLPCYVLLEEEFLRDEERVEI